MFAVFSTLIVFTVSLLVISVLFVDNLRGVRLALDQHGKNKRGTHQNQEIHRTRRILPVVTLEFAFFFGQELIRQGQSAECDRDAA